MRHQRLNDPRRGHHCVAAAQRHRAVPGSAVHDQTELRRALLAALQHEESAVAARDVRAVAFVQHIVAAQEIGPVIEQPADAAAQQPSSSAVHA